MKRINTVTSFFCFMLIAQPGLAFEKATHRSMTEHAVQGSVLAKPPTILSDLGLGDVTSQGLDGETIYQWIGDGAEWEDNIFNWPLVIRPKNHFYNPLTGQGLSTTLLGISIVGESSPSWGLEDDRSEPDQMYSYRHAREYFYKGLTDPDKATRERNLALMFRSLGQVMHLVQDAAQPQHTRNDAHIVGINSSLYEKITNDERDTLPYEGYAPVILNNPRAYWHTQPPRNQGGVIQQGQGMAEYSNRNFVSAGTNFQFDSSGAIITNPNFTLPMLDRDNSGLPIINAEDIGTLIPGTALQGSVYFYQTTVGDSYSSTVPCPDGAPGPSCTNKRATTLSIFDDKLREYVAPQGSAGLFTLNWFNFEAANQFLIPRTIGYSTGLINYFFRGRIDLQRKGTGFLIQNFSDEDMNGTFDLYYDSISGVRKHVISGQWRTIDYVANGVLAAGAEMQVPGLTMPTDADPTKIGEYFLVFKGTLGTETIFGNALGGGSYGAVIGKKIKLGIGEFFINESIHFAGDFSSKMYLGREMYMGFSPYDTYATYTFDVIETGSEVVTNYLGNPPPCSQPVTLVKYENYFWGDFAIACSDTTTPPFYGETYFVPAGHYYAFNGTLDYCSDGSGGGQHLINISFVDKGSVYRHLLTPVLPLDERLPISQLPAFAAQRILSYRPDATYFSVTYTSEVCGAGRVSRDMYVEVY